MGLSLGCRGGAPTQGEPDVAGQRVGRTGEGDSPDGVVIFSDNRFAREALRLALAGEPGFGGIETAASVAEAAAVFRQHLIGLILLDAGIPNSQALVGPLEALAPGIAIVALGVEETEAEVVAWAESGAVGFIPRRAGLAELAGIVAGILRGEQSCTASVSSALFRKLAEHSRKAADGAPSPGLVVLTRREREILRLIAQGLSNKGITRSLSIALPTTKVHVHNLLQKLGITRRGQAAAWLWGHRAVESTAATGPSAPVHPNCLVPACIPARPPDRSTGMLDRTKMVGAE